MSDDITDFRPDGKRGKKAMVSNPKGSVNDLKNKITGFLFGLGFAGFLMRWIVEFTLWFGTARTYPRPERGLIYPVVEHGTDYYVSATEIMLNLTILPAWGLMALSILVNRIFFRSESEDQQKPYLKFAWVGAGAAFIIETVLADPIAKFLMSAGWQP